VEAFRKRREDERERAGVEMRADAVSIKIVQVATRSSTTRKRGAERNKCSVLLLLLSPLYRCGWIRGGHRYCSKD
jgi:hypothetical protein